MSGSRRRKPPSTPLPPGVIQLGWRQARDVDRLKGGFLSDEESDQARTAIRSATAETVDNQLAELIRSAAIVGDHRWLAKRASHGKPPPRWTPRERRRSFERLLFAQEYATGERISKLLDAGRITLRDLEVFCGSLYTEEVMSRVHAFLLRCYGADPAATLQTALASPEEWCRPSVIFKITTAVSTGEFEEYFLTGMVSDELLGQLVKAGLIEPTYVAALQRRAEAVLDAFCATAVPAPSDEFDTQEFYDLLDKELVAASTP